MTVPECAAAALQFAPNGLMSVAVDGDLERLTDLTHLAVGEPTQPFDEDAQGDALHRIEIHSTSPWHRILVRLQDDLARQVANGRCAWRDEGAAQPRNRSVPRQHYDRAAADLWQLAPPHFAACRDAHDAAAASRNVERSPHS